MRTTLFSIWLLLFASLLYARSIDNRVYVQTKDGTLILEALNTRAIHVKLMPFGMNTLYPENSVILTNISSDAPFPMKVNGDIVSTEHVSIKISNDEHATLTFYDANGNLLAREKPGSRKFVQKEIGEARVRCASVQQSFLLDGDEKWYGLGQFQDSQFEIQQIPRRLMQVNTQISVPFVVSSKGFGLLWHQYGLTDFNIPQSRVTLTNVSDEEWTGEFSVEKDGHYSLFLDLGGMTDLHYLKVDETVVVLAGNVWMPPSAGAKVFLSKGVHHVYINSTKGTPSLFWDIFESESVFYSPHTEGLDYVFITGPDYGSIYSSYATLVGKPSLLPRWAFGFWQCRERYVNQSHLLANAAGYRKRKFPVDIMVQDWQYWPEDQWSGMTFDSSRYPNPKQMISDLDTMNMKLVISIWENVGTNSDLGKFYNQSGYYLKNSPWIDMFRPDVRAAHWGAMNRNLFSLGMGGWWMDATEPENDALKGLTTYRGPGELNRLLYPLYVSQAVYEGQRTISPNQRPVILTRSAFAGQQRYGAIVWSGDVGSTWDYFKRQVVAGLNYVLTGMPYWTTDIGGFFRPSNQYTDPKYQELLTRWFQFGAFNSIFRIHGYGTETEIWNFGSEFESNAAKMLKLRYRLLPYIYSESWSTRKSGISMMRPLLIDFQADWNVFSIHDQFSFGPNILVAPVLEAGQVVRPLYLPHSRGWFNFWTGKYNIGGVTLNVDCPLSTIPLFVPSGSILLMGPEVQYTGERLCDKSEVRIYRGQDGSYTLFEDDGDGFGFEGDNFAEIEFKWNEKSSKLTIAALRGPFVQCKKRIFEVVLVREGRGVGVELPKSPDARIIYTGKEISTSFESMSIADFELTA